MAVPGPPGRRRRQVHRLPSEVDAVGEDRLVGEGLRVAQQASVIAGGELREGLNLDRQPVDPVITRELIGGFDR